MRIYNRETADAYLAKYNLEDVYLKIEYYDFKNVEHIRLKVMPSVFKSKINIRNKKDRERFEDLTGLCSTDLTKTLTAKASVGIKTERIHEVAVKANNANIRYYDAIRNNAYRSLSNDIKNYIKHLDQELLSFDSVTLKDRSLVTKIGTINSLSDGMYRFGNSGDGIPKEDFIDIVKTLPPIECDKGIPSDAMIPRNSNEFKELLQMTDAQYALFLKYFFIEKDSYSIKMIGSSYGPWPDETIREEILEKFMMPRRIGMMDLI